jgi:hypothetical protein
MSEIVLQIAPEFVTWCNMAFKGNIMVVQYNLY